MNTITSAGRTTTEALARGKKGFGYRIRQVVLALLVLLVGLPAAGATYQAIATQRDQRQGVILGLLFNQASEPRRSFALAGSGITTADVILTLIFQI
jgi:hypothetical protein